MSIANVALSNTFNELRTTTNTVITEVNKLSDGTAVLVVDSITANTFTGVSSDLNISANTGTDVVSLVTESLRIVGTNGISTSIASSSNTINVNLDTSGVTAGAYGSASQVPTLVIDAQGRVTSASNVNVAGVSAFNYHSGNANFQIATADGGSFTASIGQDLGTSANVTFQHLIVSGNLTVTGTTTTISANSLAITDNLIYLNNDSSNTNVDLGFAGNYNDGVYQHAGLFRDADDGIWKFFDSYTPEPDASANLDTSHVSFTFAALKAGDVTSNGIFYGVGSGLTTLNASNVSSGTLANARTTASASNGASTIVARDASGDFTSRNITATLFAGSGASLTSIPNSATTASASNGASTIVARTSAGGIGIGFFDETVTALTLSGGNTAVDWNLGAVWNITLTANSTIYFTNPPSSNRARTVTLFITNSGASQKSLTVTGARYTDGVVPVLSSAASAVDAISFTTIDGGLNYYGSFILAALA